MEGIFLVFFLIMVVYLFIKDFNTPDTDINASNEIKWQIYLFYFFILWVVIEAQFFLGRFVKAQLNIIKEQKVKIEAQNKEITDSIIYARGIQESILPTDNKVKELLPDSFIFFKPKDIVSGDFYWMEKISNKILFAAVDCTGHGVPGAIVSMVGHDALNRAVREFTITEPAAILDKITEIVTGTFGNSGNERKDGMDMALCCLDTENNTLEYSGANNPLYLARDNKIEVIKADKQPVGKFENKMPFVNHILKAKPGDVIYLFSDGFADQFGGPHGKKFKYKKFRELLLQNHSEPMYEQKAVLENAFQEWKGDLDQVDDIIVMGVRF